MCCPEHGFGPRTSPTVRTTTSGEPRLGRNRRVTGCTLQLAHPPDDPAVVYGLQWIGGLSILHSDLVDMPGYSNPTSQQSRVSNHVLWPLSTSTSNRAQPGTPPSHRDDTLGGPPPYRHPSLQSASSALITMLMRCAAPASSKAMDTSSGSSKRCRLVSVRRHGERDLAVIRRRRKLYESPHL